MYESEESDKSLSQDADVLFVNNLGFNKWWNYSFRRQSALSDEEMNKVEKMMDNLLHQYDQIQRKTLLQKRKWYGKSNVHALGDYVSGL